MARKESIGKETILETGFALARQEGIGSVTARKVASNAGCSTQPIFRVYRNMSELMSAVYKKAASYFADYYSLYPRVGKAPFSNLGMAYITFAREEKKLFELLFLDSGSDIFENEEKMSMYELLNGRDGNVVYEINLAAGMGCANAGDLFMKMWIFIHGIACMTLSGDYDLSDTQTCEMLENAYEAFSK